MIHGPRSALPMSAIRSLRLAAPAVIGVLLMGACNSGNGASSAAPTAVATVPTIGGTAGHTPKPSKPKQSAVVTPQKPVAVESNPPGDIPDTTQYGKYVSKPGNFQISIPDGWARKTSKSSVSWSDKLNTVTVSW